jgi:hypothetical protein
MAMNSHEVRTKPSERRCCTVLLGILVLASLAGCGQRGPAVEFVEGRITLDGEPLSDASVGFSPAVAGGLAAYGRTDTTGTYRLTTSQGGAKHGGAPVGNYVVTVRKYKSRTDGLGPEPDVADTAAHSKWTAEYERLTALPLDSMIPSAYGNPATSGLTATVKPGRNTGAQVSFSLTSDFRPAKKRP